jgi:UrcA family protein
MLKTLTALVAAALAASALSAPAAAAQADETSVVVSYAGLDLANPADAARFERRLKAAARAVCSEAPLLDLGLSAKIQACQDDAVARAKSDLQLALRAAGNRTLALRTN